MLSPHERINLIMKHQGLNKKELITRILRHSPISEKTGEVLKEKAIYTYLNGTRKLSSSMTSIIAIELKVSTDTILMGKDKYGECFNLVDKIKGIYEYAPKSKFLNQVNHAFEVLQKDLILDDYINVKYYTGAIGAGSMGDIDETLVSTMSMPKEIMPIDIITNKCRPMLFKIVGDSMRPTIEENDWVIIDMVEGRGFYEVDGIYLCNIDSTYQIKRLQFLGTKGVEIISDNPNYLPMNSKDCDLFEIVGKMHSIIKIGSGLALKP